MTSGKGGFGTATPPPAGVQVQDGPELKEIQTDQLGFASINGDAKVRLLPSPWPADALPAPSSCLLSVAPTKGYLAAAGPDGLVFASTDKVRHALLHGEETDSNIRSMQPDAAVRTPRLSQVMFTADENCLVVSAEDTGGIIAYQVEALKSGQTNPAIQISTHNTPLRALSPNPAPSTRDLVAVVTSNGDLLIADLEAKDLKSGPHGPVLRSAVTCVSWSNKGKQLVAGLANGTAVQMKPDGSVMAEIPKSTSVPSGMHISTISWLENHLFLIIYTPNSSSDDDAMPSSEYYIVSREQETQNYTFQRLPDICTPFGMRRLPAFYFTARLRKFLPYWEDLLVVASTNSTDIGIISKTQKALSKGEPVTDAFTLTTIAEDTRRAQMPFSPESGDTSPLGIGLDLSSNDSIPNPIPSDPEVRESEIPLPGVFVLNNEGLLLGWWIVHNEAVRDKKRYTSSDPQVSTGDEMQTTSASVTQAPAQPSAITSGFGQTGLGSPGFGKPTDSAFGPSMPPSVGTGAGNTFGQASTIAGSKATWTNTGFGSSPSTQGLSSSFGRPAFGSSTPMNTASPAFGSATGLSGRPATFGQPSITSTPTFGQSSFGMNRGPAFGNASGPSPFASKATSPGFASFATANGASAFGSMKKDGQSIFGGGSFPKNEGSKSVFGGQAHSQPAFGNKQETSSAFGSGGSFKVQSSFKGDGTAKEDLPQLGTQGGFGFEGTFGEALGDAKDTLSPTHDKEAEMDDKEDIVQEEAMPSMPTVEAKNEPQNNQEPSEKSEAMITPPSTMIHHKQTPAPPLSSLFGTSAQNQATTPAVQGGTGWSFGTLPSTTPKDTPPVVATKAQADTSPAIIQKSQPEPLFGNLDRPAPATGPQEKKERQDTKDAPHIKEEPPSDDESAHLGEISEAPLPPEPTSKSSYSPGDTSISSSNSKLLPEDATLPPDLPSANKTAAAKDEAPELPDEPEGYSSGFEGSVEEGSEGISPIEEAGDQTDQLTTSPESSFGKPAGKDADESPTGGLFTKVISASKAPSRPLFGEIHSQPYFPPPAPHESPRSPSPVRHALPSQLLRPEGPRSFSAPPRQAILDRRKAELGKSPMAMQAAREREMMAAREQARIEALAKAKAQAEAEAAQELEDDEDERLRMELNAPVSLSAKLGQFLPHQPIEQPENVKSGIPGQIERLYRDLNSMIDTLGINARTLSSFLLYQLQEGKSLAEWPDILRGVAPMDALGLGWELGDIPVLFKGSEVLQQLLETTKVKDFTNKIQECQTLLTKDILELRNRLNVMRRTIHARSDPNLTLVAPLSAEQALVQHDLRKSSTAIQTMLGELEQKIAILRAKLVEYEPADHRDVNDMKRNQASHPNSPRKPTMEAITNTVAKMTAMAEKKSADIDVLEAQLRRLTIERQNFESDGRSSFSTPTRKQQLQLRVSSRSPSPGLRKSASAAGSRANSVYHTPDSRFSGSPRSSVRGGTPKRTVIAMISTEDRERWIAKAKREREMKDLVRQAVVGSRK